MPSEGCFWWAFCPDEDGRTIGGIRTLRQNKQALSKTSQAPKAEPRIVENELRSSILPDYSVGELKARLKDESVVPLNLRNETLIRLLFDEWLRKDPVEALTFAKENRWEDLTVDGLRVFGARDRDTALTWIKNNTNDLFLRNLWEESVYAGLAANNPEEAMAEIKEISEPDRRQRLLRAAFNEWAAQDNGSAFEWIEKQEKTPFLAELYVDAVYQYIDLDPEKATSFISSLPENRDRVNFANEAAFLLAEYDVTKAVAWVDSLQGETQYFASRGLLASWAASADPLPALSFALVRFEEPRGAELFAKATRHLAETQPSLLVRELSDLTEAATDHRSPATGKGHGLE